MKRVFLFLSIFFLFAFALLSKYEDRAIIRNLDFTVTVKVQDFIGKFCTTRCDGLFEDIGFFASPLFSIAAIIVFATKRKSLLIPVLFALLTLAEMYGKTIVGHPAPPFFMLKNPTTIFPTYHVWQEFSYPSGHAARAMFLALLAYPFIKKKSWIGFGLAAYIGLISFSRIYLGHHWFSDVVGGWLLGAGTAFFITL
ncbi:hypothetical protein A3A79_01155 [Candidatus Gottesmanbacteria bacterium RIFCSPLOWO2_01_FULL_43_11b]|uniref:Phosphatidic acid phosphatase type 2/haloperoxidase domain-containing protein n=1 Tax=Candidatus Gottesmanbacteria bacterium RIFCSPLOWO2_01_FULL_43_11b TaxID=1798392 RepID=A0A1F6AHQ9_9BACT|nr:MAG: hypothetical protein A3A79_01155 [Candidatus Gottesmanbacteria bacterium RIFCSPLOWO2_01_FULL_43_11b]